MTATCTQTPAAPSPASLAPAFEVLMRYVRPSENSDKFYRVFVVGCEVGIHYGRRGAAGVIDRTSFDSSMRAVSFAQRKVREKLNEGYVQVPTADAEFATTPPVDCLVAKASGVKAKELRKHVESGKWDRRTMMMMAGLVSPQEPLRLT